VSLIKSKAPIFNRDNFQLDQGIFSFDQRIDPSDLGNPCRLVQLLIGTAQAIPTY
jgi:hypothetical protein